MGEPSLHELERDVEAARAKLGRNLSTLSSPATYSQFSDTLKDEAVSFKDAAIVKAKTSIQSSVEAFVDDLKAKAAANPTAALAIGAGIAWRLIQRPPVATVLVGAGLFSLLRTDATHSRGRTNADYVAEATERFQEQASDFAADVTERAGRAYVAAADRASELAVTVKESVGEATSSAAEQITGVASAATERLQEWSDQASATLKDAAGQVTEQAASLTRHATDQAELLGQTVRAASQAVAPIRSAVAVADPAPRDSLLLAAASVAVIAALGIASQRRLNEPTKSH